MPKTAPAYEFLLQLLSECDETARMNELLSALLTEKEQSEFANRILIFALLQQGLPQREISEKLGVGIATVSRGAKAYQLHSIDTLLPTLKDRF